jgi:hypothetical protein
MRGASRILQEWAIAAFQLSSGTPQRVGMNPVLRLCDETRSMFTIRLTEPTSPEPYLSADVRNVLNFHYTTADRTAYFDVGLPSGELFNFAFVFPVPDALDSFTRCFIRIQFQASEGRPPRADENADLEEQFRRSGYQAPVYQDQGDDFVFGPDDLPPPEGGGDGGANTILRLAPRVNRGFVLRHYPDHCDLGLFGGDHLCEYQASVNGIRDPAGRPLMVGDILTSDSDRGLLLVDPHRPTEIFGLRLDRGEVHGQIEARDNSGQAHRVKKLLHENRDDSASGTFLGFSGEQTFRIDPRSSVPIVGRSDYKTNNRFSAGLTTRSGYMAMASETGIVRLYKEPCLGKATVNIKINIGNQPITGIDISPDENWVVATAPYNIAVFTVLAPKTGKSGFIARTTGEKPPVLTLTALPQDQQAIAARNGGVLPQFTSARFDCRGGRVVSIVASLGHAILCWPFRAIENGQAPKYSIQFLQEEYIVDDMPLESTSDVLYLAPNQYSWATRQERRRW